MTDYRRHRVPGGCYFFTVNLLKRRGNTLLTDRIDLLREAVRRVRRSRPFSIDAWVVLPDHRHAVWTLPPGDDDFSSRWRLIKSFFVRDLPKTERLSRVRRADGERGIWQRRFWSTRLGTTRTTPRNGLRPLQSGEARSRRGTGGGYSTFKACVHLGLYPPDWIGGGV